jgi:CcmD family protein
MNLEYLFAAYAVITIVIFAYMYSFTRRQKRIEREIQALSRILDGEGERR